MELCVVFEFCFFFIGSLFICIQKEHLFERLKGLARKKLPRGTKCVLRKVGIGKLILVVEYGVALFLLLCLEPVVKRSSFVLAEVHQHGSIFV